MNRYVLKEIRDDGSDGYTDLALERRRVDTQVDGVEYRRDFGAFGAWEKITIESDAAARSIGRPIGHYDTLTIPRMDMLDIDELEDAKEEIAKNLCRMCDRNAISPERILVVGLGNAELTPDSVGPKSAERVKATMHLRHIDDALFTSLECSEIAVVRPGVRSQSGIETSDFIKGVCDRVRPDVMFAIDSLAARSPSRLGTTVQISDTGIFPGSGLRAVRNALTKDTLGIPVIAIGVPTVINSRLFIVENGEARAERDREGMFVSPKDIGEIVDSAAYIISGGINQAFGIT